MKEYNEDDENNSVTCRLETAFGQDGKLCDDIDALEYRRKQLDLFEGNITFCHVDCFCLQEKR